MDKTRVLLADDHAIVLDGLNSLLARQPDIQVVGQATDGRQAVALCVERRPDAVVMDIAMKGMNGLEATRRIQQDCPGSKVVILSMYSSQEYVYQALRAGAAGFVVKEAAAAELVEAIHAVLEGQVYLSPRIWQDDIQEYIRRAQEDEEPDSYDTLTSREREVLQLIAEGHTTREIGNLIGISPKTVETHRSHLMRKLDIHTTAGLTRFAISRGIIDL
jgi:two-component system response regulator NreC